MNEPLIKSNSKTPVLLKHNSFSNVELVKLSTGEFKNKKENNPLWVPKQNSEDFFKFRDFKREEKKKFLKNKLYESANKANYNHYSYRDSLRYSDVARNSSLDQILFPNISKAGFDQGNVGTINNSKYLTDRQFESNNINNSIQNIQEKKLQQHNNNYSINESLEKSKIQDKNGKGQGIYLTERKINNSVDLNNIKSNQLSPICKENEKRHKKCFVRSKSPSPDPFTDEETKRKEKLREKSVLLGGRCSPYIKDFISKTKEIILLKYDTKIKEERIHRLHEEYNDQIDKHEENINNLIKSKEIFNGKFDSYDNYFSMISKEYERKNVELKKLQIVKYQILEKIKAIENQIFKQKNKLALYLEYKLFLINVYQHKMVYNISSNNSINLFKIKILSDAKLEELRKKEKNQSQNNEGKMNIVLENEYEINQLLSESNSLFSNASGCILEISNLEQENLNCMIKYNNLLKSYNTVNKEYNVLKCFKDSIKEEDRLLINAKQSKINLLKGKNTYLLKERLFLLNPQILKVKKTQKIIQLEERMGKGHDFNTLKNKIYEMYKVCYKFYFNKISNNPTDKEVIFFEVVRKNNDISQNILAILTFIDKIYEYLSEKHNYHKQKNYERYLLVQEEFEKQKQIKKYNTAKILKLENIKMIKEKLMKKQNIILPIRKVQMRLRPIEKKRSNSISMELKNEKLPLLQLLEDLN